VETTAVGPIEQRRHARLPVDQDRVRDGLDAVHVKDDALRQTGMQRRLDRGTKAGSGKIGADERVAGLARRIPAVERGHEADEIDRNEDRLVAGFGEPAPGGLHPWNALVLHRGVAAGRLDEQAVASEFGGDARQRRKVSHGDPLKRWLPIRRRLRLLTTMIDVW
jgi:hypothetical protein